MNVRVWVAIVLLLVFELLCRAPSKQAFAQPYSDTLRASEEVWVVGERPGPRLWKVSDGHHTLWILGTQVPLPKRMTWRSGQVETVIASSNEILGAYSVSLNVQDDDQKRSRATTLKNSLPARVYEQWLAMRGKYIDKSIDTENLVPTSAALLLQMSAYEKSGLTYSDDVWRTIGNLAKKYHVPIRAQDFLTEPVVPMKSLPYDVRRAGVNYLTQKMDHLEDDFAESRARANAWANGDMEALLRFAKTDESDATRLAHSWPFLRQADVSRLIERAENKLAAEAERALVRNETTFAALPIYILVKEDGLLARLAAGGYAVNQPP